ncbi:uncharacterized protein LOC124924749 [Impatiens glandulifera]|uniref:uncharacterized protein LOC124924749 n=1 Tax=Impatiens glandulifera TaxID=253017 RepID=UPI001FB09EC2|nr:uncharacterized protein LOC124924749 [Impatiens glandulifera]
MASTLIPIGSPTIRSCATPSHRDPYPRRQISSPKWWSPIFNYSTDTYYIDSTINDSHKEDQAKSGSVTAPNPSKSRFTDEKARHLRLLTTSTSSFHDAMYHSAIASRLASDFPNRSNM